MHAWLWLSFLARVGMNNNTFDAKVLDETLQKMSSEYIRTINKRD